MKQIETTIESKVAEVRNFEPLNFSALSSELLIQGFDLAVLNDKKATHIVLQYIHEITDRNLHFESGYESVYKLLTKRHKYSSNQAYDRIDAARVLKNNPEVIDKVQEGSLNLTQLIKVGQCIKQELKAGREISAEKSESIFAQIENKTIFETEKVLAVEMDFKPRVFQKITPQKNDTVTALLVFTTEDCELILRAQKAISHSVPNNDLGKAFAFLAKAQLQKVDGKAKATDRRSAKNPDSRSNSSSTQSFPDSRLESLPRRKRRYISIKIRRQLETGSKSISNFCLQVDHITPLACGGSDQIRNLRVLCGFHNRERLKPRIKAVARDIIRDVPSYFG
ncbi:MAG: HNH endonuclease [Bdellovibrionaceae bacterium]|nr:HNH endonuclease [Pseudobdellovibrionaceae bacterium]